MARFRKKVYEVDACRLVKIKDIKTSDGVLHGDPGDWLIRNPRGEQMPVKDDAFRELFEPVDDAGRAIMAMSLSDAPADAEFIDANVESKPLKVEPSA